MSVNRNPDSDTEKTPKLVMIICTHRLAVTGIEQFDTSFERPFLSEWFIKTITFFAFAVNIWLHKTVILYEVNKFAL